jgi:cytoskeletal protein RodZ
MSKLTKLVAAVAVLAALAVGGAAFAQAQNASTAAVPPTQQGVGEPSSSSDTDGVQSGSEQAGETDSRDSASEQNDAPDSAAERDTPVGPGDPVDGTDEESRD